MGGKTGGHRVAERGEVMPLTPFFSLNPLSPQAYTYNPANPNAPYAAGYLMTFGGKRGMGPLGALGFEK